MQFILSSTHLYLLCIAMVAITSTLWWNTLGSPWSFVLFSGLTLLGTHCVYLIASEAWNLFSASGQMLEYKGQATPESIERAQSALTAKAISASIFVLVAGTPLLVWLKALLAKARGQEIEQLNPWRIWHQPNWLVKPTPTSFACWFPPCCALRCGLPRALGSSVPK
ncbi:MAG: hypothetical protein EOO88_62275 [Pedobacter sp.]|nr:MAG: hypothetical protein EOO88_62275 [Pedobacter sp.]